MEGEKRYRRGRRIEKMEIMEDERGIDGGGKAAQVGGGEEGGRRA